MFSKELEQSIASLFDQAQEKNIQYITIEHLLLMILNDFDSLENKALISDQTRTYCPQNNTNNSPKEIL